MKYAELSSIEYLDQLASAAPVPGGGGTAALAGALACALGSMVGSLTEGKKAYTGVQEDIRELMAKSEEVRSRLTLLIDRDPEVFAPLSRAYKMPTGTEEERTAKEEAIQTCTEDALSVPLEILDCLEEVMDCFSEYAEKGSDLAVSDAACGAAIAKGAIEAAALNVYVNTRFLKDSERAASVNRETERRVRIGKEKADRVIEAVSKRLTGK